ncbi:hypothetical protein FORC065_3497 [Yersinia enterocolitica]|nr:hypothetical protein FORC065_3497 [Yersinia enterocolitica]
MQYYEVICRTCLFPYLSVKYDEIFKTLKLRVMDITQVYERWHFRYASEPIYY